MAQQDVFQVLTAIVCFCSLQPMFLVSSMVGPEEKPAVYPEEHVISDKIPEMLLIELNKIENLSQLQDFFGPFDSRIGNSNYSAADRTKLSGGFDISRGARCQPEEQTVELEKPNNHAHVYWPMCVRVHRCGGCCTSKHLTCVPVETSKIDAKVLHAQYTSHEGGGQFQVVGMKVLTVEKHDKCTCQCREQPKDCTELQEYKAEECKCTCTNMGDMAKCSGVNWMWDTKTCSCKCRHVQECSTGFFYNGLSCRCEASRASRIGVRKYAVESSNTTSEPEVTDTFIDFEFSNNSETTTTSTPSISTTEATTTETTTTRAMSMKRGRMGPKVHLPSQILNVPAHKDSEPLDNSKDQYQKVKMSETKSGNTIRRKS